MNIVDRKEFMRLCGDMKSGTLRSAVSRKQIQETSDKKIDIDLPKNREFMLAKLEKAGIDPSEMLPKETQSSKPVATKGYSEELEKQQKLKTEKARLDLELSKKKIQKLNGELIPVDKTKQVFAIHFKNVTKAFYEGLDNLLNDIRQRFAASPQEIADLKQQIVHVVNTSKDKAVMLSTKEVDLIQKEYSDSRGVGEHS